MRFSIIQDEMSIQFDSFSELMEAAKVPGYVPGVLPISGKPHSYRNSDERNPEFRGSDSMEAFFETFKKGWTEGASKAREMLHGLEQAILASDNRPAPFWDVAGDEPDVERFLSGEPENMISWTEEPCKGSKVFTLAVNLAASAKVVKERLVWRGVVAAALVDRLEQSGVRVEVLAYVKTKSGQSASNPDATAVISWPVKAADSPLDLERVALGVAHPSMLRRVYFSVVEKLPENEFNARIGYGYGAPALEDFQEADLSVNYLPSNTDEALAVFRSLLEQIENPNE